MLFRSQLENICMCIYTRNIGNHEVTPYFNLTQKPTPVFLFFFVSTTLSACGEKPCRSHPLSACWFHHLPVQPTAHCPCCSMARVDGLLATRATPEPGFCSGLTSSLSCSGLTLQLKAPSLPMSPDMDATFF